MVTRWVILDTTSGEVESDAYETEKEAWKAQVELAGAQKRSPYEWAAFAVQVNLR